MYVKSSKLFFASNTYNNCGNHNSVKECLLHISCYESGYKQSECPRLSEICELIRNRDKNAILTECEKALMG